MNLEAMTKVIETFVFDMRAERRLYPDVWAEDLARRIFAEQGDDDAEFHVGRNHPDTSREMSDKVKVGSLLEDVLYAFMRAAATHQAGATDDDIEVLLGRSHQSVSGARNTLVKKGYLVSTGRTRPNRYNNRATIWTYTGKERA